MSGVSAELHDTLLYLDGVTVSFDGFRALNSLSLVLEAGEMRAVIPVPVLRTCRSPDPNGRSRTGCAPTVRHRHPVVRVRLHRRP